MIPVADRWQRLCGPECNEPEAGLIASLGLVGCEARTRPPMSTLDPGLNVTRSYGSVPAAGTSVPCRRRYRPLLDNACRRACSGKSNIMSSMISSTIDRNPRAAGLFFLSSPGHRPQRLVGELQIGVFHRKQFLILLHPAHVAEARFQSTQNQCIAVCNGFNAVTTGKRPTNSGIRPNSNRSSLATLRREVLPDPIPRRDWRPSWPKPIGCDVPTVRWMIFSMPTNVPPQMNRMLLVSIWMYCCSGCFRPPCGGTLAIVPSSIFNTRSLLHPFARNVASDRNVLAGFADLVDFVDIQHAPLRALQVKIGCMEQLQQ